MTLEVLLLLLGGAIISNVVLLIAASRSGALRDDRPGVPARGVAQAVTVPVDPPRSRPLPPARSVVAPAPAPPARRGPADPVLRTPPGPVVARASSPPATPEVPAEPRSDVPVAGDPGATRPTAPEPNATDEGPATALDSPAAAPQPPDGAPPPPDASAQPPVGADKPSATTRQSRGAKGRRGRRFVLPPIDVDHARTERVMLSLLSTENPLESPAEVTAPSPPRRLVDAWEQLVGPDDGESADRSAIVVALTVDGIERLDDLAGRASAERVVTAVLDGLRRSARATDRVASVGRGHFRVLLVDADEPVATGFVARVRAAVDRRLVAAPVPLELVAGWAEAASVGDLEAAVHQAEERRRAAARAGQRDRRGRAPA